MTQELHNRHPEDEYLRSLDFDFPAGQLGTGSAERMNDSQQPRLADLGEQAARNHLQEQGYRILESNWRAGRRGELDLIACDTSGLLVFAEVKTRLITKLEAGFDWPGFDAIHRHKQRQIISLARMYLSSNAIPDTPCRFDVLVVWYPAGQSEVEMARQDPQLFHIVDAFSL